MVDVLLLRWLRLLRRVWSVSGSVVASADVFADLACELCGSDAILSGQGYSSFFVEWSDMSDGRAELSVDESLDYTSRGAEPSPFIRKILALRSMLDESGLRPLNDSI